MDWQEISALAITAVTAAAFVWAKCRPRRFRPGRHSSCGCAGPTSAPNKTSVVFHARKGEPGRVIIRTH